MQKNANRTLALALVGSLLIVLGLFLGPSLATLRSGRSLQAERLDPATAAQVEQRAQGREVLVEGRVATAAGPAGPGGLLVYVRERQAPGSEAWAGAERVTLPLTVVVTDGVVLLLPGDYAIEEATVVLEGPVRYRGFRPGDLLTIIGTVVEGPAGHAVQAEAVFGGTRDDYIVRYRRDGGPAYPIGYGLAAAGALCLFPALRARLRR